MSLLRRVPMPLVWLRMSALSPRVPVRWIRAVRVLGVPCSLLYAAVLLAPRQLQAAGSGATSRASEPPPVHPSEVEQPKKTEAARRFDRALQLFESGDNAGALAEFKRVYEIFPEPVVLYNMGLVYAAMSRPVDAVDALERVVATGERLNAAQLQRAKQTLQDQMARVARLTITTRPAPARIEVDGIEVAKTPLDAPIRIAEGKHVIGAVAEGYAPANKELFVAGNSEVQLSFELISTQSQLPAHIAVRTQLPGVRVLLDGKFVGNTPLAATISAAPGPHSVEMRRPGYSSATRVVNLESGATAEIALDLAIDPQALEREAATLVLDVSESPVEFWVDGETKTFYQQPIKLPRGPHHLRISTAGFIAAERNVTLDATRDNVVHVVLEPTAETRRNYQTTARFHRTWGWTGVIGGAVIAGSGAALALIGSSRRSDGQQQLDALNAKFDNSEPPCDYRSGYASAQYSPALCNQEISDAQSKIDSAKTLTTAGLVGVGVGGAVLATGLVLLLTGDDPKRYERPTAGGLDARRPPRFAFGPGPGEIGSSLRMAF